MCISRLASDKAVRFGDFSFELWIGKRDELEASSIDMMSDNYFHVYIIFSSIVPLTLSLWVLALIIAKSSYLSYWSLFDLTVGDIFF